MITIRTGTPQDVPQEKELWKKCFGDASSYIDVFYQKFCDAEQVLVVDEDGEINSMAAMLPGTIHLPEGRDVPVGYVYALATNPYVQGKGHARQLLAFGDKYLQERGMEAMVLVPASPSLHRFFEAIGMEECFATRKVEILTSALTGDTGGGTMTPISPKEYNEIRESYLKDTFHVSYTDQMIQFQQIGSHLAGGDLYKFTFGDTVGCGAIEYVQQRRILMKELILPQERLLQAVEVVSKELEAIRYHVRTPAFWDGMQGSYVQPFGMITWYDQELKTKYRGKEGYLGLAFD